MGIMPAIAPTLQPPLPFPQEGAHPEAVLSATGGEHREGLFRSRFAEEAGLTPEQVAQIERMGLFESSEGLLPPGALPLARAIAKLLAWGATMDEIAALTQQVRQETAMHQRLLQRLPSQNTLPRVLQWQEQTGAVTTIREILLQRWGRTSPEES